MTHFGIQRNAVQSLFYWVNSLMHTGAQVGSRPPALATKYTNIPSSAQTGVPLRCACPARSRRLFVFFFYFLSSFFSGVLGRSRAGVFGGVRRWG